MYPPAEQPCLPMAPAGQLLRERLLCGMDAGAQSHMDPEYLRKGRAEEQKGRSHLVRATDNGAWQRQGLNPDVQPARCTFYRVNSMQCRTEAGEQHQPSGGLHGSPLKRSSPPLAHPMKGGG